MEGRRGPIYRRDQEQWIISSSEQVTTEPVRTKGRERCAVLHLQDYFTAHASVTQAPTTKEILATLTHEERSQNVKKRKYDATDGDDSGEILSGLPLGRATVLKDALEIEDLQYVLLPPIEHLMY